MHFYNIRGFTCTYLSWVPLDFSSPEQISWSWYSCPPRHSLRCQYYPASCVLSFPCHPSQGRMSGCFHFHDCLCSGRKKYSCLAEQHIKDCRKTGKTIGKRHCVKSQIFMPEFARMPIGGASTGNRGVLFDSDSPFSWSANLLLIQITERDQIVNMRYASVEILSYPHNKCRIH